MEIYFLPIPLKKKGNFEMYNLIGQFCLFIGLCFSAIGLFGVLRFKNLYQRMHSISLIDSLGFFFFFAGLVILSGLSMLSLKILLVYLLVMLVSPTVTHVLAMNSFCSERLTEKEHSNRSNS